MFSCGSASNIAKVAQAVHDKYAEVSLVICLEDDHTADSTRKAVEACHISGISFRNPDFTGVEKRQEDKDFDDLRQRVGIEKVAEQLRAKEPETRASSLGLISRILRIEYFKNTPLGIDLGLKIGEEDIDKILLPAGGYSVFAASTKHGKTQALGKYLLCSDGKRPNP